MINFSSVLDVFSGQQYTWTGTGFPERNINQCILYGGVKNSSNLTCDFPTIIYSNQRSPPDLPEIQDGFPYPSREAYSDLNNTYPYPYHGKLNNTGRLPISHIFDPSYIIENKYICTAFHRVRLLVLVLSVARNVEVRKTIRETWGSYKDGVVLQFVTGFSSTPEEQLALKLENDEHHDIIQCGFVDTWKNLKLKILSMLQWAHLNCKNANYILKIDDDVFANLYHMTNYLESTGIKNNTLFGYKWVGMGVIRDPGSWKYYLAPDEFVPDGYMPYLSGPAFVFTPDTLYKIFKKALTYPITRVCDDVFITGFVAEDLNIHIEHNENFNPANIPIKEVCNIKNKLSIHGPDPLSMRIVWNIQTNFNQTTNYTVC